jgi:hypothetical protein
VYSINLLSLFEEDLSIRLKGTINLEEENFPFTSPFFSLTTQIVGLTVAKKSTLPTYTALYWCQ